jgi:hypothetical protein
VIAAVSCGLAAEEPERSVSSPAASAGESGANLSAPALADMSQALDRVQQMLRDQAAVLRSLQQEIERQGLEIAVAPGPSSSDPAADAALLQSAALRLRTPRPVISVAEGSTAGLQTKAAPMGDAPANLFFRIGNAVFTPSGWVDFTGYFRSTDVGSGLGTNFQSIPFNSTAQGGLSEVRLSAQSSRFAIRVDENVARTHAYGYLEADFNGYLPGNASVSTNSNTLRMRVFYLNLARGKWEILGGQAWSLLTPTRKALSPFLADLFNTFHLETSYQAGLVYARRTQLRFVYHPTESWTAGISIENPEQFSSSVVAFPELFSTATADINSSSGGGGTSTPNLHPDVIAKTTFDRSIHGLYWHMGLAGLLTPTRIVTPASITKADPAHDSREGGAVAGNAFLEIFKGLHLLALGYWSDGGGRYIGGLGPRFVVLQKGSTTASFSAALIHSGSGIGGFEWAIDKRTTFSTYFSSVYFQRRYGFDPDINTPSYSGYGFPGSANTNNRTIQEASLATIATLWQKPECGALQVITQSSYARRAPWYVAAGQPKDAHTFMEFMNLRYVLP